MKPRARRLLILLAVIVAGSAAVGAGTYAALRLPGRGSPAVEEIIRQADEELSKGQVLRAEELLRSGFRIARGEKNLLRLLGRELRLAEMSGSYRRFARRAREAAEKLPGSAALAEAAAYGLLRSEHPEDAPAVLSKAPRRAELDGLRLEAYLRGLLPQIPADGFEGRLGTIAELPTLGDPGAIHTLAVLWEEPRLDLDAALLWLGRGQLEEAFSVLWPHRELPEVREALLLAAYDAGKYAEAWELLGAAAELVSSAEQRALRGDLAWLLGMPERAAQQYQLALEADPQYSWVPYLNLAGLMGILGDREGARRFRLRAFERFPESPEVVLAHARDLAEQGEGERAREILAALVEEDPELVSAQLLVLELEGARGSPALYQGRMWELFNRHPEDPELARSFALYLLGLRDTKGAAAVLAEYGRAHGAPFPAWYLELKGALALAQGKVESAAALLGESVSVEPDWRRRYNLAVVLMAGQRYEQALQELIQSETELSSAGLALGTARLASLRSRIRSRIGEAQVGLGDREAARREALYALDLDPGNHHARRVLGILEGLE